MTLWELAQGWRFKAEGIGRLPSYELGVQSRTMERLASELEQWARETSGDWNKVIELSEQNDSFSEEFKGGLFQGISSCLEGVGVPEADHAQ